jgi:hypothetical protein
VTSARFAGELAVPERGERHPVDEQAGVVAGVLLAASFQEPRQEGFPGASIGERCASARRRDLLSGTGLTTGPRPKCRWNS